MICCHQSKKGERVSAHAIHFIDNSSISVNFAKLFVEPDASQLALPFVVSNVKFKSLNSNSCQVTPLIFVSIHRNFPSDRTPDENPTAAGSFLSTHGSRARLIFASLSSERNSYAHLARLLPPNAGGEF